MKLNITFRDTSLASSQLENWWAAPMSTLLVDDARRKLNFRAKPVTSSYKYLKTEWSAVSSRQSGLRSGFGTRCRPSAAHLLVFRGFCPLLLSLDVVEFEPLRMEPRWRNSTFIQTFSCSNLHSCLSEEKTFLDNHSFLCSWTDFGNTFHTYLLWCVTIATGWSTGSSWLKLEKLK